MGWIGVDLDGTLAEYHPGQQMVLKAQIGPPIMPMVNRIKRWIAEGQEVRILTARASGDEYLANRNIAAIEAWTKQHIGVALVVTAEKDYELVQLWDDKAVAVEPNTGRVLGRINADA